MWFNFLENFAYLKMIYFIKFYLLECVSYFNVANTSLATQKKVVEI